MQEITINSERLNGASATAKFNIGETAAELIEQFGEEVVYSHVRRSLVIAIQAAMRGMTDAGKSPEEIQEAVTNWKPGLKKPAKSALEKAREELAKMSPADRKALVAQIKELSRAEGAAA
jgi:hypothetical protein